MDAIEEIITASGAVRWSNKREQVISRYPGSFTRLEAVSGLFRFTDVKVGRLHGSCKPTYCNYRHRQILLLIRN
jgi:hypothetical protein